MKQEIVTKEIQNDGLTPMLVYKALGGKGCCMLESAYERGEGRTSVIGIDPIATFTAEGTSITEEIRGSKKAYTRDPYDALKEFTLGQRAFGFVSYDAVRIKEQLPDRHAFDGVPDFFFHIYKTIITFDHNKQKVVCSHLGTLEELEMILGRCFQPLRMEPFPIPQQVEVDAELTNAEFAGLVEKAQEYIRAGDIFQVVLSRKLRAKTGAPAFEIYRALRQTSPSSFHFFFEEEDFAVAGASPELLISVQEGEITSMPIAGTCPKGVDPQTLLSDPKECAEHVMLVDLARNDVGAIALPGSVQVAEYMSIKSFSHVSHILSRVTGKIDPSFHCLDVLKSALPAGTLSGAPKVRAMEIIDELEHSRRGIYGGAIVSLDENGSMMSCIAIRMAMIRGSDVEIRVGAGIVLDSVGEKEAKETEAKAQGVIAALELAEGGCVYATHYR